MSLFDDFSKFLETRLEEFLRNNPDLELQALLEQLREQERDTLRLITELESEKKRRETEILTLAQDIQKWHERINKAKAAGRLDLAQPAQEREAALLRQGNLVWGQMEGAKKRMIQAQELLRQIQQKRKEVETKAAQAKAQANSQKAPNWDTKGWNEGANYRTYNQGSDNLDKQFERWELDEELERMKRDLRK